MSRVVEVTLKRILSQIVLVEIYSKSKVKRLCQTVRENARHVDNKACFERYLRIVMPISVHHGTSIIDTLVILR